MMKFEEDEIMTSRLDKDSRHMMKAGGTQFLPLSKQSMVVNTSRTAWNENFN